MEKEEILKRIQRVVKVFSGRVGLTLPEQFALDSLYEILEIEKGGKK